MNLMKIEPSLTEAWKTFLNSFFAQTFPRTFEQPVKPAKPCWQTVLTVTRGDSINKE
jgi:hypothetical protein